MAAKHGAQVYVIDGEPYTRSGKRDKSEGFIFDRETNILSIPLSTDKGFDSSKCSQQHVTKYTRLFNFREQKLSPEILENLGNAMFAGRIPDDEDPEISDIPAAYTYLGQFIAHDMTLMQKSDDFGTKNYRSPKLDLDSVYAYDSNADLNVCAVTSGMLPLGCAGYFAAGRTYEEDLPRTPGGEAVIGDLRNDDVLPVAQTHVAMIKFANQVRITASSDEEAKMLATEHFQSVVLHDYLRRVCDCDVWKDVMHNGRAIVMPGCMTEQQRKNFEIPIEFAMAFRFGHSMVRESYQDWVFKAKANLAKFWDQTHNSGSGFVDLNKGIGWGWVNNWYRLLNFSGTRFANAQLQDNGQIIRAAAINPFLATDLGRIPERALPKPICGHEPISESSNLAVRTLTMHHALELPDGRKIADYIRTELAEVNRPDFEVLDTCDILRDLPSCGALSEGHRDLINEHPPLWFYVLREAQRLKDGASLGPVGSRIVLETIHAAIEAADISILHVDQWHPDRRLCPGNQNHYTFADLVAFAGDPAPVKL